MSELTGADRRAILEQQRRQWLAAQYDVETALRVHRRIGTEQAQIETLMKEAVRCEKALAALAEMIAEMGAGG